MQIAFRTDASNVIGTGHVMRCLALADGLKSDGHHIKFVMRPLPGDLTNLVKARGFDVVLLEPLKEPIIPSQNTDYSTWLPVTQEQDVKEFIEQIKQVDLVIIDQYGIGVEWEAFVSKKLNCQLAVIDDLLREHECDILIDQTLGRKSSEYLNIVPSNADVLTGSEYALLKTGFAHLRKQALNKPRQPSSHKILVTMGGVDNSNATYNVLNALLDYKNNSRHCSECIESISVLINSGSPNYQQVIELIKPHQKFISQYDFVDNMAELMLAHTLSIGAPGATSWERACLGLPSIIIPLADNQQDVCQKLVKHHAAIKVELSDLSNNKDQTFSLSLTELLTNYELYRENALLICDGLGVKRVQAQIKRLADNIKKYSSTIQFFRCRLASQADIEQVYLWQKMPETRQFALNPKIPLYDEHVNWMKTKLRSAECYFYIIEVKDKYNAAQSVGVIRLDRTHNCEGLWVSIFIEPKQHGKGLAGQALSEIITLHNNSDLHATILDENMASKKLFLRLGFKYLGNQNYIKPSS
jgi:UDP-2,4-diacetamido-2,4,6-trideoxy-beta-L-altropyranose hydrolase